MSERVGSNDRSAHRAFVLVAVLGLGIRLAFALSGWLRQFLVADDGYYYFTIAQNVLAGRGSTFDGLAPTNGYHPLWLITLVGLFPLAGNGLWAPVEAAQIASALLDLCSGAILYRMLRRCGWGGEAVLAAAIWFLSPWSVLLSLRGMEASLSTLFILLLAQDVVRREPGAAAFRWPGALVPGLLLGLAGLARTDNAPVLGIALTAVTAGSILRRGPERAAAIVWLASVAAVATLVLLPWFLWNLSTFGTLMQVSGEVKFYSRRIHGALWGASTAAPLGLLAGLGKALVAPLWLPIRYASGEEFKTPIASAALLTGLLLLIGVALRSAGQRATDWMQAPAKVRLLVFAASTVVLHTLLFGLVWRSYANWYALPMFAILAILLGVTLGPASVSAARSAPETPPVHTRRAPRVFAMALALAAYALFLVRVPRLEQRSPELMRRALASIAAHHDGLVTAGAWNAGLWAWLAREHPDLRVVNLDGLVNNVAFDAVKHGTYGKYLYDTADVLLENPRWGGTLFLDEAQADSLASRYRWDPMQAWVRR